MTKLPGKVVLLTGASAGIGWATAVALTRAGAHVVATARRTARLDQLAAACADHSGQLLTHPGDVRDPELGSQLVEAAVTHFSRLDVLINNAGLGHKSHLDTIPPADVNTIWQTNLNGPLQLIQAALPQMRAQGNGQIINVSSIVGERPLPRSGVYCASKAALNTLTRSLRLELHGEPIHISLVYPGGTHTEFAQATLGEKQPPAFSRWRVPAEKVAAVILQTIRRPRPHVTITPFDWTFMHLNRLFPRTIDFFLARMRAFLPSASSKIPPTP